MSMSNTYATLLAVAFGLLALTSMAAALLERHRRTVAQRRKADEASAS